MLTVQALQNTRNDGDFNRFLETVLEKANLKRTVSSSRLCYHEKENQTPGMTTARQLQSFQLVPRTITTKR